MIVADARRLTISTATGAADPRTPFVAFAGRGSVLEIGHPLLREMRLARIGLDIDWAEFPDRGLRRHYRGYPFDPPIRNASFAVAVTAPLAGWASGRMRKLFAANGVSRFELVAKGGGGASPAPLKITLIAPAEAFGDAGYAEAVMAASTRMASGKRAPLPNAPWRPLVARIVLRVLPA